VHPAVHLGCEDDVLTPGEPADRATHEFLGGAALVDVRGVPEGDAQLDRLLEERRRGSLVQRPLSEPPSIDWWERGALRER
jgi:hypothetical protein